MRNYLKLILVEQLSLKVQNKSLGSKVREAEKNRQHDDFIDKQGQI